MQHARQDGVVTKTILAILTVLALIGGALGLVFQGAQLTTALSRLWARRPGSRRRKLAEALTLVEPGDTLTHIERTVGKSARGGFRSGDELSQTIELSDCRLSVTTDSDGLAQRIRVEVTRGASLPPVTLTPNAGSPLIVALGRSRFAALDSRPCAIWWSLSASAADYRELHYLGRPGDYRHFIFIAEMSDELVSLVHARPSPTGANPFAELDLTVLEDEYVQAARGSTAVRAYIVVHHSRVDATDEWKTW